MEKYIKTLLFSLYAAISASASSYDVAAIIWPAYHPEPRWQELGIFNHGVGEWQNVYEAVPKFKGHDQPSRFGATKTRPIPLPLLVK